MATQINFVYFSKMKRSITRILQTGLSLLALVLFITGCGESRAKRSANANDTIVEIHHRTWNEIVASGTLRAITVYNGTGYFLYKGRPMGYEYDLLKRLAKRFDLKLDIILAENIDSVVPMLNRGEGDLVAYGLAITQDRKGKALFTNPLYLSHQVLVQRKPRNYRQMRYHEVQNELILDPTELIGDTISVRAESAYLERLIHLQREIGGEIHIDTVPGNIPTEKIIRSVAEGDLKYTISDNNIASINAAFYPILDVNTRMSLSQRIAWMVHSDNRVLRDSINIWLDEMKDKTEFYVIYNKYFKNKRSYRARVKSEFYSLNNERISQYDDIIKRYAANIGWDWRLLASIIYQESQFNPVSESWADALGLMQLMPETAERLEVMDRANPEESIRGGTKYLNMLMEKLDYIPDSIERVKMALASYNCGLGHVLDARRLAEERGYDKDVWTDNVELAIIDLAYPEFYNLPFIKYGYVRGLEPVTYVEQIFERYNHYCRFIELETVAHDVPSVN